MPIPINMDVPADEFFAADYKQYKHKTVQINGWYRLNLFTRDTFRGQIIVPGYHVTNYKMLDIRLERRHGVYTDVLQYLLPSSDSTNRLYADSFGILWMQRPIFHNAMIVPFVDNESSIINSPIITLNTATIEEAMIVFQNIMSIKNSYWESQ